MIQEVALRDGLRRLLKQTEDDIRQRLKDEPALEEALKSQHAAAAAAGRSAASGFSAFRDDAVTQAVVHWLLGCVFVRFLEDNRLVEDAWIAGPGDRLTEALDRRALFYRENPRANDSDYLLHVFDVVSGLPDMAELYHREHNPLWRLGPTGTQAMQILRFLQQRDENTGGLLHDFTDPDRGTRFLGDLYQNLSDFARKRYALCQTPGFVIDFILDRTLSPAIREFGLEEVRLIDPTCGSGHFLLASFDRLYTAWEQREPAENSRARVQRALDAVYGVDLNPFAVAIARFRLLVASLKACGIRRLQDAPDFRFQLAAGDSLLHGPPLGAEAGGMQRRLQDDPFDHYFETEDAEVLRRILGQPYHAVVGNPPYINVQDPVLREQYRARYGSCHGKYQLSVPFIERFFNLTASPDPEKKTPSGFVGLLVSSSFAKKAFGVPIIKNFLSRKELTHVIDMSGVYLPAHGTATFIMFARNEAPRSATVRAVRGIRGETSRPEDPTSAPVWSAIVRQVDCAGSESHWVSVSDAPREVFDTHPWAMGGGGAAELKESLEEAGESTLGQCASSIGITSFTLADDIYTLTSDAAIRSGLMGAIRINVVGESLRDWNWLDDRVRVAFPYGPDLVARDLNQSHELYRYLWSGRTTLANGLMFGSKTKVAAGLRWYEFGRLTAHKLVDPLSIAFSNMETQNHFVLIYDTNRKVFNPHAPLIKLKTPRLEEHLSIVGLLNSSIGLFWLKQVCLPRGGDQVGADGARVRKVLWDVYYEYDSTKLKQFPLPEGRPLEITREIQAAADARAAILPDQLCANQVPNAMILADANAEAEVLLSRMIALQEELDWQVYHLYGLLDEDLSLPPDRVLPMKLGQRPFEILMARQMAAGELDTTWFERHGSTPITEIPAEWPRYYRHAVERRLEIIQTNRDIALIEQPEYKRRWNLPSWAALERKALENWLLDRMESADRWQEPELQTCARLADSLRRDAEFVQVAGLYEGRPDFDMTELVTALVKKQSVPFLPVLRYKPSGLEKRREWEAVWALQRREDAGEKVEIPVPPKYRAADFLEATYWNLRGGLDVPKERFILYPHLGRDADSTPVLGWAGWNHLQQAQALAGYYHHVKEEEGWSVERLKPVLAGLLELIPWLKQWHNDVDPGTGERMGDTFEAFLEAECQEFGFTKESLSDWTPPQTARRRGRSRGVK